MPHTSSQVLHRKLDKKLRTSADWLRLIIKERGRLAHPYKITSTGEFSDDALKDQENDSFADSADYATRGGGFHPPSPSGLRTTSPSSPSPANQTSLLMVTITREQHHRANFVMANPRCKINFSLHYQ